MNKKEYILNQFKKTFNKKFENYCITRIYHLLKRDDIQIITQQLFRRSQNGKIALADLYFPQLNMYVEIDEHHHKFQNDSDVKRKEEVSKYRKSCSTEEKLIALGEVIYYPLEEHRIDASCGLEDINLQIDKLVNLINDKIEKMGDKFVPWTCSYKEPKDYVEMDLITARDNVCLRTLQEVSELFNRGYRGNQRCYFATKNKEERVWCPKLKIEDCDFKGGRYKNEISPDGQYIYETEENNDEFYSYDRKEKIRIVFPKYKDETGCYMYKFKGIYKFNRELSQKTKKAVWEKISESINLKQYFLQ